MAKKEETPAFDWMGSLTELDSPADYWIVGLEYYITSNNLNPKNMKELEKIASEYGKLSL